MSLDQHDFRIEQGRSHSLQKQFAAIVASEPRLILVLWAFLTALQLAGCVSDKVDVDSDLALYQQYLADQGPQRRSDTEGRDMKQPLSLLRPAPPPPSVVSVVAAVTDPNTDPRTVLTPGVVPPAPPELAPSVPSVGSVVAAVTNPNTDQKTVFASEVARPEPPKPTASPPPVESVVTVIADSHTDQKTVFVSEVVPPAPPEPAPSAPSVGSVVAAITDPNADQKTVFVSEVAPPASPEPAPSVPSVGSVVAAITDPNADQKAVLVSEVVPPEPPEPAPSPPPVGSVIAAITDPNADQKAVFVSEVAPPEPPKPVPSAPSVESVITVIAEPNTGQKTILTPGVARPELPKPTPSPPSIESVVAVIADPNTDQKIVLASGVVPPRLLKRTPSSLPVGSVGAARTDPKTDQKTVPKSGVARPELPKPTPSPPSIQSVAAVIADPNTDQKIVLASGVVPPRLLKRTPSSSPLGSVVPARTGPKAGQKTVLKSEVAPPELPKPAPSPSPIASVVTALTDPNTNRKIVLTSKVAPPELPKPTPSPPSVASVVAALTDPNTDQKKALDAEVAPPGPPEPGPSPPPVESVDETGTDPNTDQTNVSDSEVGAPELPKLALGPSLIALVFAALIDPNTDQTNVFDSEVAAPEPPEPAPAPSSVASVVTALTDPNADQKIVLASGVVPPGLPDEPARFPLDALSDLEIVTDPNTGQRIIALTIEQAVARMLANSPEIRVVSFDPSIAKLDVTRAASQFDFTAFGRVNYEEEDSPPNSIFQPGQSDVRTYETGIKQMGVTGAEWSVSYALTRSWDDLVGRALPTRYEPILGFQLTQPLLRDAWQDVTLAGVNIAKLNYEIALLGFREKSEDIATQVISAYWALFQARRDAEIHQELLDRTLDTLRKVEGRREIDATDVQIKQTEAFAKIREAALLHAKKVVWDAQEMLVRLMADVQLNVLDEFEIVPVSEASVEAQELEPSEALEIAMRKNPIIQQARIGVEIADINIRVAENQKMPRLDLTATARTHALAQSPHTAHDRLETGDFASYAIGLSLEYPLGNRQREAELLRRRLERRKAIATLQNVADQVAIAAKEGVRRIGTTHSEIQVQKEAVEAARIHLQTLTDTEPVRERLTPEFLLVKLQAQETLANAQRAEIGAVADFNMSLVQLARILGTVLELHQVRSSLPIVSGFSDAVE